MKDGESVDVLIVGAGPAGSSAARSAAEAGTNVLVIEKRARIGEPIRCAEYIPRLLTQKVKVPREAIVQEIEGMVTFMPDGEVLRKSAPGFTLDRAKFDQALAAQAERAGARFLTGNRAVCKADNEVTVVSLSGERGIRAKVVIGADGPGSTVGSWIGQRNRNVMWAVQQTVELKQSVHDTEVYFDREYPGGYAWLFPKGDVANVGVGVKRELGGIPKEAFRRFEERVKDRIGKLVSITAGRIPVGGPLLSIDEKAGIILVGDAAGHTHAITGGGVPQAVLCGTMAGTAAADYAKGNKKALQDYAHQWREAFGATMNKAAQKRQTLETGWDGENLDNLVRRCWIACEEYYHEP
ncbi:MAG: NAD(P)/FAD-dependent oxidoreductase [Desulfobacteraceae bacterium]|nr:NAD(P)/FAD-dependent oxidoreductase [Desulfobacteraceae bacterium]